MNALTWTCSCGATHFFERRTPAEHEAWLELNWDRVLGRFGGVLSPLNRHEARSVRSRRRVGGHV